ncbi:MAG: hypothetical protein Q4D06_04055 [Coriobacteriia bacterium]|nr:hypothetical protein [Coriobacteriia bacterium]
MTKEDQMAERIPSGDDRQTVLSRLLAAHQEWFNVYQDYEYAGERFPGYAEFHSHGEKYVLVKRAKLWEVDAHEYLFFRDVECLDVDEVDRMVAYMTEKALQKVHPEPNHMQSFLSLVFVADQVTDEAVAKIRKTSFRKNFKLGFQGWADLRLAVVDLSARAVHTNGMGKEMKASLEANSGFAQSKKKFFRR